MVNTIKPVLEILHEYSVVELRLNRPSTLNAINPAMYNELARLLDEHSQGGEIRAIVLTASGPSFTAGLDIQAAREDLQVILRSARNFMHVLMRCRCIVIAGVYGLVTAIGVTLLLHCDIVFAHPDSTFTTQFYLLGIVPEFSSSALFPKLLGPALTSRLLFQGHSVPAHEFVQRGVLQFLDERQKK